MEWVGDCSRGISLTTEGYGLNRIPEMEIQGMKILEIVCPTMVEAHN